MTDERDPNEFCPYGQFTEGNAGEPDTCYCDNCTGDRWAAWYDFAEGLQDA